ncbi:MAG: hypothetical protein IJT79_08350 [Ruminococcus sp.]|nr:hypothetical protein [Ruminococcus sp.]
MANKIKGITIKIGGDTIDLDKALKGVNKESVSLNSELNQINRQLKFDPSSAVLLSQKQEVLKENIEAAKNKLKELENVQQDIERQYEKGEIDDGQYRAYQREVEQAKDKIKSYESQLNSTKQTQQDFNRKIEAARVTLDKNKESLKSGAKSLMKWGAAATAAATGGLFKIAENAVETTDNIDKMSQKIGISRQAYQELDFICSQTGANVDNLKMGLKTMRSVMETAASGTSKSKTALEQLGISATDLRGHLRGSEEVMWEAFSALQQWPNETEKARLATKLFGRAGSDLMPLLNGDADSIEKMKNKAHELGLILSDEAIDSGVEFKDTLDQTKRSLEAAGNKMATAFLPALSDILTKLQEHMPEIQAYAEKLGKKIGDDITWLIDNGDTVIKMIKITGVEAAAIWTAVKTYKFVQFIGETVSAMKTLKTATEAQKAATISATAATEAETVAQEGLNVAMSANVIGAVISGLIILGSTIWAACEATEETTEATHELSEEEKELNGYIDEQVEKYDNLKQTRQEAVSSAESEYDYYNKLYKQLTHITDENGRIKKGYEDKAKFITTTLADALGKEIGINGNIIQNYKDLRKELKETIKWKKYAALQSAYEDEYNDAVKNQKSNKDNYLKYLKEYNDAVKRYENLNKRLESIDKEKKKLEKKRDTDPNWTFESLKKLDEKIGDLDKERKEIEGELKEHKLERAMYNLDVAEKTMVQGNQMISSYTALSEAIISKNEKKIKEALNNLSNDFITAKNGTEVTLTQQVKTFRKSYTNLKQALADGAPGVTQEMVDGQKGMLDKAKTELNKWYEKNGYSFKSTGRSLGKSFSKSYVNGLTVSNNSLKNKVNSLANTTGVVGRSKVFYKGKWLGNQFILGYIEGLRVKQEQMIGPAESLVSLTEKAIAAAQQSNSPARRAMPLGSYFTQGYFIGAEDEATKSAKQTGRKLVNELASKTQSFASSGIDINASLNSKLAPFTSGGMFTKNSTSKIINNTPAIHVSFGSVSVRSNDDIRRIADRVSETIAQRIELKGVSMGL